MRIDSHLHLWVNDPEKYPWQPIGGYVPEEDASLARYMKVMGENGVDRAVLVQPTPYGWDNRYLLDCKAADPEKFKAVVLVDPLSGEASQTIRELEEEGADGLRINLQLQPLARWQGEGLNLLLATCTDLQLPICFQTTPEYLGLIGEVAAKFEIPFIVDHLGRPEAGCAPDSHGFKKLINFSDHPNIYVKLSGMNYYSNESAPYRDTWSLLQAAKNQFGADHCIWGSDFPFVEGHWTYAENMALFNDAVGFEDEDLEWIMGETARSIWWDDVCG
ncbi:MAG: amidohydrolase family protein [Chloroflexota bacterium]|nr:amidohydrolase family protein [Chloroflexota bacterium]